jgi:hypothetical protein
MQNIGYPSPGNLLTGSLALTACRSWPGPPVEGTAYLLAHVRFLSVFDL